MEVKYKQNSVGIKLPKYDKGKSSFKIYALEDVLIKPSEMIPVKTGFSYELPEGYGLLVFPTMEMIDKSRLRFATGVVFLGGGEMAEMVVPLENITPLPMRPQVVPEYYLLDGTKVHNYSHGYVPINSILVKKNDCIGEAVVISTEIATILKAEKPKKKVGEQTDGGETE